MKMRLTQAIPTSSMQRPACLHTFPNTSRPISPYTLLVEANAAKSEGVQYVDVVCSASIGREWSGMAGGLELLDGLIGEDGEDGLDGDLAAPAAFMEP